MKQTFEQDLCDLINRHSKENDSNTPDFILAQYLRDCLDAFNKASNTRETWYGKFMKPGEVDRTEKRLK